MSAFLGAARSYANGLIASWSVRTGGVIKEEKVTKPVRYQDGCLYADHAAWFVKYRVQVRQEDGSIKLKQRAKMLGRVADYPRESRYHAPENRIHAAIERWQVHAR
jgi:hypothetical protein